MFTTLITSLTSAEIAADIHTCETILRTGHVNGIYLDSECEAYYRDRLAELQEEQNIRDNPEDYGVVVSLAEAA